LSKNALAQNDEEPSGFSNSIFSKKNDGLLLALNFDSCCPNIALKFHKAGLLGLLRQIITDSVVQMMETEYSKG